MICIDQLNDSQANVNALQDQYNQSRGNDIYTNNIEHTRKVDEELNACRELLRKTNEEAAALRKQYEGIH